MIESGVTEVAPGRYHVDSVLREREEKREKDAADTEAQFGSTLEENRGIVATCGAIHQEVLDAVQAARG